MAIVVAGGTRGIGLELAEALSDPGELVVLGYGSDEEAAQQAQARLTAAGRQPVLVRADMGTPDGAAALAAAVGAERVRVAHR